MSPEVNNTQLECRNQTTRAFLSQLGLGVDIRGNQGKPGEV